MFPAEFEKSERNVDMDVSGYLAEEYGKKRDRRTARTKRAIVTVLFEMMEEQSGWHDPQSGRRFRRFGEFAVKGKWI